MLRKNEGGVYCLGLHGLGGLGKTTMCKEMCSYFGPHLKHKVCHVEMIVSNKTDPEKLKLKRYKKILEDLSDMTEKQISTLNDSHKVSYLPKHNPSAQETYVQGVYYVLTRIYLI